MLIENKIYVCIKNKLFPGISLAIKHALARDDHVLVLWPPGPIFCMPILNCVGIPQPAHPTHELPSTINHLVGVDKTG